MSDDVEWGLVDSFGIDGNELDGLTPQECFVLGVEWQMTAAQADQPYAFSRPIHLENRDRIEALLKKRGREYRLNYMHGDVSESWLWLEVNGDEPKVGDSNSVG